MKTGGVVNNMNKQTVFFDKEIKKGGCNNERSEV